MINTNSKVKQKFELGKIVATQGVLAKVSNIEISFCLSLHAQGIWGSIEDDSRKLNNLALKNGTDRLFSEYVSVDKTKFWIITDANRSFTTVLLPEEYKIEKTYKIIR